MKRKETWIRSCSHLVQQKSKPLTQCKKRGARELRPLEASFNKGYGVVPCSCCLIGFVQCLFSFVSLLGLLWLHVHSFCTSKLPTVRHVTGIGTVTEWLFRHSSLEELEVRLNPVGLWDAVRVATVWRRTRTSRQSLSLLLHSLEAADEVRDVPCWHDGWVLLRVPLELLSALLSHRTSQHSVSASEGLSSWSPRPAKDTR